MQIKHLTKIKYFHDNNAEKIKNAREFPQSDKGYLQKFTMSIKINLEWLNIFFIPILRQKCLLLPSLFNMILDILATAIKQEK